MEKKPSFNEIKQKQKEKINAYKRARSTDKDEDWVKYNDILNELSEMITKYGKIAYNRDKILDVLKI